VWCLVVNGGSKEQLQQFLAIQLQVSLQGVFRLHLAEHFLEGVLREKPCRKDSVRVLQVIFPYQVGVMGTLSLDLLRERLREVARLI